ncbi:MAG: MFS transporter [Massilia sp.]
MAYPTEPPAAATVPNQAVGTLKPGAQAWLTLAIATVIYTLNVADRFIFPTLLQSIKAEFALSDTGVASLNLALGLVLMLFGIPAGILADRVSRRYLLGICATLFSAMTALGGMTTTLTAFVVTRLGLGLGEAGCTPPSLTLIADRFPAARRGVAMTIFTLGVCAGSFCGTAVAGALSDLYGWRTAMLVFGLSGLPLGLLAMFLIKEPVRGGLDKAATPAGAQRAGVFATLAYIWRDKTLCLVMIGGATICTWGWGLLWWTPAFLMRTYGLTGSEGGAVLGKLHLVGGATATVCAAIAMHWLSRRGMRVQIWAIAGVIACAAVASIVAYTATHLPVSVLCLWLYVPVLYMYTGPTFSLINNMAPPGIRAKTVAVFLLATSFGNLILAPMLIGFLSDLFAAGGMPSGDALRRAMGVFAPLGLAAAGAYAAAGIVSGSRNAEATPGHMKSTNYHV